MVVVVVIEITDAEEVMFMPHLVRLSAVFTRKVMEEFLSIS